MVANVFRSSGTGALFILSFLSGLFSIVAVALRFVAGRCAGRGSAVLADLGLRLGLSRGGHNIPDKMYYSIERSKMSSLLIHNKCTLDLCSIRQIANRHRCHGIDDYQLARRLGTIR